jgi:hypothetical protein
MTLRIAANPACGAYRAAVDRWGTDATPDRFERRTQGSTLLSPDATMPKSFDEHN